MYVKDFSEKEVWPPAVMDLVEELERAITLSLLATLGNTKHSIYSLIYVETHLYLHYVSFYTLQNIELINFEGLHPPQS